MSRHIARYRLADVVELSGDFVSPCIVTLSRVLGTSLFALVLGLLLVLVLVFVLVVAPVIVIPPVSVPVPVPVPVLVVGASGTAVPRTRASSLLPIEL